MSDKVGIEEIQEKLRHKRARFRRVFGSLDGKKVMEDLAEQFDNEELRAKTPHDTYYNLGRRDVVVYIKQVIGDMNNE